MKTLVIQSYRAENVPPWIRRCLDSVEAWANLRGFDYLLAGDDSFALCGDDYLARVGRNMRAITNLSRLELVRDAHRRGYDRAIWLDADILVFHPELFTIDVVDRYAFARETWIKQLNSGWVFEPGVNNCTFVCMRGEPDLDFLIQAVRHVAMNRTVNNNYQVGGDLIRGLKASLDFATLDNVGMFSHHVVLAIAEGDEKVLATQAHYHGTPVFAANLCASELYSPPVPAEAAKSAIDRLLETRGGIVNDWLLKSPNNLLSGQLNEGMARLFSHESNVSQQFRQAHGHPPNLQNPQTFNELTVRSKLDPDNELRTLTADKYAVREYVADRIGEEFLIPLLQVCDKAEDLDLEALPPAFIVKAAHASGWREVVRDKSTVDATALKSKIRKWLNANFYSAFFEPHYRDIPQRAVVERLLLDANGRIPKDYKLFVFRGVVRMIQVVDGRFEEPKVTLFDPAWRRLNVSYAVPAGGAVTPPARLKEMLSTAEALARDFDFVRVDLYCVDDKVYFGELTHTPNGGVTPFKPPDFDLALGQIRREGGPIPAKYYETAPLANLLSPRNTFRPMAGAARNGPVPAPAKPPANTPAAERVVATTKPSHTPAKPTPIASPASWDGYFINLARDEKRRRHMESQFAELGIQGRYQRFEAVDGSRLERSSSLTPGEVGVYRSHLDVLEQAASDGRPVHILEDDTGLCDLTAPAIDAAAQNGAIDDFDILFLDFMPPETMSAIRVLHALYQEVTKNGSTVIDNPDQLKIIDIQNLYQWNTTSYVVGPRNIGRVLAVLREEWRRGPGLAVDMAIQAAARTKQLRLGSFFPFVTTVSLEQNQDSSKGRTDALDAVIARNIFRHSFFVRRNIKGFAAPALARLIERHRQPDPEGAIDLYVDLQRYQLTKPRQ